MSTRVASYLLPLYRLISIDLKIVGLRGFDKPEVQTNSTRSYKKSGGWERPAAGGMPTGQQKHDEWELVDSGNGD
ncbi:MAG: hypothetical protein LBF87_00245 [Treponema sp.]|nr:hypothetical protein [Treponema sp.]